MLTLNLQPKQKRTSPAEKLFGHKVRTTLSLLIPSTKVSPPKTIPFTQNLTCKFLKIAPGTTVRIRTEEQNLWEKKGIIVNQSNFPRSYDI